MKIYKKIFIIILLISLLIIISIFIKIKNKDKADIKENIQFYKNNIDNIVNPFNNRFLIKDKEFLYIGKNKNELENNYFDIKIIINENNIKIYINKLFKEFDGNLIYDENYTDEIVEFIIKIFNLNIDKGLLTDLISTNYLEIRDIDKRDVEYVDKVTAINDFNINIKTDENILVIEIGVKDE